MEINLKTEVRSRTPEERAELSAYLRVLERLQDDDFQQAMGRRSIEMSRGDRVLDQSAVAGLHEKLRESDL